MITFSQKWRVHSYRIRNDGKLEIILRSSENYILTSDPPQTPPDQVKKEIYGIKNDRIVLEKVVPGKVIPPRHTIERIVFDDEEEDPQEIKEYVKAKTEEIRRQLSGEDNDA